MDELAALRDRRMVECDEPGAGCPIALNRIKSIPPIGAIDRGAAMGMNSRWARSATPSAVDARDERYYGIRGNVTQNRCGLYAVCMNYDDIRWITEGGTSAQKSLLRNNHGRFPTREAAQAWSETPVATIFPKKLAEFTPAIKMLAIVTCVLVFLYFVRDLLGIFEERMGCARNQFSFMCDLATDAKKFVKDQQYIIVNAIGKMMAIWIYKVTEYALNNMCCLVFNITYINAKEEL
jgi:hypothetical protein